MADPLSLLRRLLTNKRNVSSIAQQTDSLHHGEAFQASDSASQASHITPVQGDAIRHSSPNALSRGELFFLARFKTPIDVARYKAQSDFWSSVTGKQPADLLREFERYGLIEAADLCGRLVASHSSPQLSEFCRTRGLGISGTKSQKAARLVKADSEAMQRLVYGIEVYSCSKAGLALVEAYERQCDEERRLAEDDAAAAFLRGDYAAASRAVAAYEAKQPVPRGMGIDWNYPDVDGNEKVLVAIANGKPRILAKLTEEQLASLRLPAAMMYLWGTNRGDRWLPRQSGRVYGRFDADTAATMLLFYGQNQRRLTEYRANYLIRGVGILDYTGDSCAACRRLIGKTYSLAKPPELPNPACTSETGCRCSYIAIIE